MQEVLITERATLDGLPGKASMRTEPMNCNDLLEKQRELKDAAKAAAKLPKPKGRPPAAKPNDNTGEATAKAKAKAKAKASAKGKSKAKAKPAPAPSDNESRVSWLH